MINTGSCCPVCREPVGTYRPTGTRVLRSLRHLDLSVPGGVQCTGSLGPVVNETEARRDAERTTAWAS